MEIRSAIVPDELDLVRTLFREYASGVELDLCFQGVEAELAELPGRYAPPNGRLLLAMDGDYALGCVALRRFADDDGEMKRLYVRSAARGLGAGRALVDRVVAEARAIGYRRLLLDTLPPMTAAIAIYVSLGFHDIAPHGTHPVAGTRSMALEL